MLNDNSLKKLKKDGFVIINTKSRKKLEKVRFKVFRILISELKNKRINHNIEDIEFLFNNFHKLKINDSDLNSIRVNLIKKLNKNEKIIEDLYKIFNHDLKKMLGLDIVGQRKVNLVIQKPNDKSVAPIHRDSPPNSPHEIVFWLPLVNCYKTKSINILESKFTDQVNKMFNSKKLNYKKIEDFFKKKSTSINCNFGQILLFLTPNFHYIPVNVQNETRFSLNFRFKNLFSAYGSKSYPEYFKIMNLTKKSKLRIFKNV